MTNWQEIATELYEALRSFMAYDGTGQGGAAAGNSGDWPTAEKAVVHYNHALMLTEVPSLEQRTDELSRDWRERAENHPHPPMNPGLF